MVRTSYVWMKTATDLQETTPRELDLKMMGLVGLEGAL